MTITMNSEFRKYGLDLDQMDKIERIESDECQEIAQDLLVDLSNDPCRAMRAVVIATASLVFEHNYNDLEIMYELCQNVKPFQNAFLAATLVIFGAKSVKPASGKSAKNTYYVDPCNVADLSDLTNVLANADFSEMEKRFNQYMGSAVKTDKGLKINAVVCNANGTLTNFSNAYKVAKMTTVKAEESNDTEKTIKNVKAYFKKLDLSKAELETVLNEVLKSSKMRVQFL